MTKELTPFELAEIVSGLIVNPAALGEMEDQETHFNFLEDIAQVVGNYCGGACTGVVPAMSPGSKDDDGHPMVCIRPTDSLPSMNQNVWSLFDDSGWDDEQIEGVDEGVPHKRADILKIRSELLAPVVNQAIKSDVRLDVEFPMVDWAIGDGEDIEVGDEAPYWSRFSLGNQTSIEIFKGDAADSNCPDEEPVLFCIIEVNKGVPAIHLSPDSGDNLVHISRAQGGFVLVPDRPNGFQPAGMDRHAYMDRHALLIK